MLAELEPGPSWMVDGGSGEGGVGGRGGGGGGGDGCCLDVRGLGRMPREEGGGGEDRGRQEVMSQLT